MKIVIITTEPSGDFLGHHIIKSLKKRSKKHKISGVGGELMESIGFKSWVPIKKFNTIGLFEVLIRILKYLEIFRFVEKKIRKFNPDLIITIDSPSFSYRLAKRLQDLRRLRKIKFVHYVAPTVWAWKSYRAKIFAKFYDFMFTIFCFESKYFLKYGLKTKYIGHQIFFEKTKKIKKKKQICFLPGSRSVEIKNNLNSMRNIIINSRKEFHDFKFYILTFDNHIKLIDKMLNGLNVEIISDYKKKQTVMAESYLAIAASGSVTLELSKYHTPMIVVYNTYFLTRIILKMLVRVKYASIINITFNKEVVPEYIFEKFKCENVLKKMRILIKDKSERQKQIMFLKKFSMKMTLKGKNPADLLIDEVIN
tara:strand:+ start:895 stop:1992 length:1098 start_codon:yes stop_codon:yes gene_type:complete